MQLKLNPNVNLSGLMVPYLSYKLPVFCCFLNSGKFEIMSTACVYIGNIPNSVFVFSNFLQNTKMSLVVIKT